MPRGTLGVSRKKSLARCVNMDFSKLMFFFCLTYATDFAEKERQLLISNFPVNHFKMPIKPLAVQGKGSVEILTCLFRRVKLLTHSPG